MEYWVKFNELGAVGWTIVIAYLIFSIYMMVWAYRRKGLVGFLLAFFLNWLGWIIVALLRKDDKSERERERAEVIFKFIQQTSI
jgi:cbb3-type cytochrome oxidase subunit 3